MSRPKLRAAVVKIPAACPVVYTISDSTGNLSRHMLTAFLTQFPAGSLTLRFEAFVRTGEKLGEVLRAAKRQKGVICHAMVSPKLKQQISEFCATAKLPCCDLTGGVVEFLSKSTGVAACTDFEALHRLDEAYRQRIGALEFTLSHDDGLGTESLTEADIILVGVSRTSKTPTSIYLAQQGYRVANVSLALGIDPPTQLKSVPPERVVALTIDPQQLVMIRTRRETQWNMSHSPYGNADYVAKEVAWARRLFAQRKWPILDVTDQAVEETAARIVDLVDRKRANATNVRPDTSQLS